MNTKKITLTVLTFLALLLLTKSIYLFLRKSFPIKTVKISAPYINVSKSTIKKVVYANMEDSFIFVSCKRLHAKLCQIPWVKDVAVVKKWPEILEITLHEKVPKAYYNNKYLCQDGSTFRANKDVLELVNIYGPEGYETKALQIYQKLSNICSKYGIKIVKIKISSRLAYDLELKNHTKVFLGKKNIMLHFKKFAKMYPKLTENDNYMPLNVDLRYPHAMAIKWKENHG